VLEFKILPTKITTFEFLIRVYNTLSVPGVWFISNF